VLAAAVAAAPTHGERWAPRAKALGAARTPLAPRIEALADEFAREEERRRVGAHA
jgi:hypothetical protein